MLRVHVADLKANPGDQHALIGAIAVSAQNVDAGRAVSRVQGNELHQLGLGPRATRRFPLPGALGDITSSGGDGDLFGALDVRPPIVCIGRAGPGANKWRRGGG